MTREQAISKGWRVALCSMHVLDKPPANFFILKDSLDQPYQGDGEWYGATGGDATEADAWARIEKHDYNEWSKALKAKVR